jgi:hypothetical protein
LKPWEGDLPHFLPSISPHISLQINEEAEKAKDGVDAAGETEEETKRQPLEPMQAEEEATA